MILENLKIKEEVKNTLFEKGYCIIATQLKNEKEILDKQLEICSWVGNIREHNPGKKDYIWPICVKKSESKIATFSEHNDEAELHTDTQYRDLPERYMTLSCIEPAKCGGGETILLDSRVVIDRLNQDPELLKMLHENFPIAVPDIFVKNSPRYIEHPIISDYPKFRFRYDTFKKGIELQQDYDMDRKLSVIEKLHSMIESSPEIFRYTLKKGEIILIDNHRVLHGRTSFSDYERLLYRVRVDDFQTK